jgi:hypothetical protein
MVGAEGEVANVATSGVFRYSLTKNRKHGGAIRSPKTEKHGGRRTTQAAPSQKHRCKSEKQMALNGTTRLSLLQLQRLLRLRSLRYSAAAVRSPAVEPPMNVEISSA